MEYGYIIQPENWHNHASCLVQLPDDDILVCWYHGSGERSADDVLVEGSRYSMKTNKWSSRFLMADVYNYPDCNPCMFIDPSNKLWLVYVTILANEWHTALLRSQTSVNTGNDGCPIWNWSDVIHVTPDDSFITDVLNSDYSSLVSADNDQSDKWLDKYLVKRDELLHSKLFRRLGWMPRAHATVLNDNRIILPLYSDGFDFSIMIISDNNGITWKASKPLISPGGVQPSVVEKNNGELVAFMRNNGPAPHRMFRSKSSDRGESWSIPEYIDLPNPGSGIEAIRLRNGIWVMIYNNSESNRYDLAAAISTDEGESWQFAKYLENDNDKNDKGRYSYPSIIQTKNDDIWVTYTAQLPDIGNTIKWMRFDTDWLK